MYKQQLHIDDQKDVGAEDMSIKSEPLKVIETDTGKIFIHPPRKTPTGKEKEEIYRRIIECLISAEKRKI